MSPLIKSSTYSYVRLCWVDIRWEMLSFPLKLLPKLSNAFRARDLAPNPQPHFYFWQDDAPGTHVEDYDFGMWDFANIFGRHRGCGYAVIWVSRKSGESLTFITFETGSLLVYVFLFSFLF